jgi:hypothetical protein
LLTFQAAIQLDLSACGAEKNCEKRPPNCKGILDCDTLVISKQLNDNQIEFEIFAAKSKQNYVALGFSDDTRMVFLQEFIAILII